MFFRTTLMSCLVVALITRTIDSFMNWFYLLFRTTLMSSLLFTFITRIIESFMNRVFMFFMTTLMSCLVVTLITGIIDTFMNWFYMLFSTTLIYSCLLVTLVARVIYRCIKLFSLHQKIWDFSLALSSFETLATSVEDIKPTFWWEDQTQGRGI